MPEFQPKLTTMQELYPIIEEVLAADGTFTLTVTGGSMWPTLGSGRDRVTLAKPPKVWRKYDLPLYRRDNGQYVLHRIVRVHSDGTVDCCGDHQWHPERGLRQDQLLAIVTSLQRKNRHFSADSPRYVRWVRIWTWLLPFRPVFFALDRLRRSLIHKRKKI